MRHLATIQKIADVQPIEGADSIEKVRVKDWWCVAKKGEFNTGNTCVYFEIDSLLPSSNPAFSFLAKGNKEKKMNIDGREYTGYKLKTIKLRGQLSQGLALPLEGLLGKNFDDVALEEGSDISALLGVIKYEAPIPANLAGVIKGEFPKFLRKTDEERVQNLGPLIELKAGVLVYVTEKVDGSSVTIYKKDGQLGVCSRNWELHENENNAIWKFVKKHDLKNLLPEKWALQGEIIGEGIQGNPLKIKGQEILFFNVFNIENQQFENFESFESKIQALGLKTIPVMNRAWTLPGTVEEILALAEGPSLLSPECKREGIVIRPVQEMQVEIDDIAQRFSFKAISNEYLLNEKE